MLLTQYVYQEPIVRCLFHGSLFKPPGWQFDLDVFARANMITLRKLFALTAATGCFATCDCGKPDQQPARPEVAMYLRVEDQERARLSSTPCGTADEGAGCYRSEGSLWRKLPCEVRTVDEVGALPTDQCFKMEAPRRYRGIWIDEFEGQRFLPEGANPPEYPLEGDLDSPEWRRRADLALAASIWIDVDRVQLQNSQSVNGRRFFIEFVGRKTMYPGSYGHFGMFGQEIIVDRLISLRECSLNGPCTEPD